MNNTITTQYPGRSLEDLKSSRRAVQKSIDDIAQQAAIITEILPLKPGRKFWCVTEIDWADIRLSALRESYFELIQKASNFDDTIACLENDDWDRYMARKKANKFLSSNFSSLEEEAEWLRRFNLNALTLAEEILKNPNFLSEVTL